MQILLIIQELHGLARDSIQGYEKLMSAWADRPEIETLESQQISRRVILQELRKAIDSYKAPSDTMAPSEGYQAINERQLTGNKTEMRGTLDDLLRGENFYLYRIDDARTRYPAVAAHLSNIHSTIRDNRDLLSAMLAREENFSSISIEHPNGDIHEGEDQAIIDTILPKATPTVMVKASDAELPVNFRQSAAGETPAIEDVDAVDPLPAAITGEGEGLPLSEQHIFEVSDEQVEGQRFEIQPKLETETELDLIPVHDFDYDPDHRMKAIDNEFEIDASVSDVAHADTMLEHRVEAAMPNIAPLDSSGNVRRSIMTRRGRFDPDAVRADANDMEAATRRT